VTANSGEATTTFAELELLAPAANATGPKVTVQTPAEDER
jgi:hypothetical protein